MATVKIDQFGGIAPRQHPTQLADGMAVKAHNVRLKTGKLVPLREPKLVEGPNIILEDGLSDVADAKSLHVWRKADGSFDFLLFKGVTWSAPGNIAADDLTRIVVSGDRTGDGTVDKPVVYIRDSGVKVVYEINKDPLDAPKVDRAAGSADLSTGTIRYTRFFVTWVDKYNMESPVSPASLVVDETYLASDGWTYDAATEKITKGGESIDVSSSAWTVTMNGGTFVSAQHYGDGDLEYLDGDTVVLRPRGTIPSLATKVRVYKVITGMEEGRIQFVYELDASSVGAGGFSFTVKDEDAGEIMPEIEAPPEDLSCIHDVPGAFYVGFSPSAPKTVCFSDIDLLYSWPVAYRYDVADNLVALAVTSNTVFALTDGWPYVLSGTAPESMAVAKLAGPAACVSPRGVCVYRNAVYYVGNQGLMTIYNSADAGTVCQNLTDKIFTKDQWLAYNPSSCVMGQFDGALVLFFTLADGSHKALSIDLMENSAVAVTTHDEAASCLCVDNREDKLYYVREGGL